MSPHASASGIAASLTSTGLSLSCQTSLPLLRSWFGRATNRWELDLQKEMVAKFMLWCYLNLDKMELEKSEITFCLLQVSRLKNGLS